MLMSVRCFAPVEVRICRRQHCNGRHWNDPCGDDDDDDLRFYGMHIRTMLIRVDCFAVKRKEWKKRQISETSTNSPLSWLFSAWAVLVLLVLLWPDLTWFPLKGNAAVFFFWITCGIVTCFCLKRVFVPSDSPLPSFKGQLFLFPISRRERSLTKTKSCNSLITCQAMRREKPNERLSGNSPSDTRFEIFPMIDFRSTLWCLAFILKAFNVEILLSLNFSFA